MIVVEILGWCLLLAGSVFCAIGGLGLLRMPEFYTRTHAASITDTLGASLVFIGLLFQDSSANVKLKLVIILVFLLTTSPTSGHALVKAAYAKGMKAPDEGES